MILDLDNYSNADMGLSMLLCIKAEVECLYHQDFQQLHDECIANGTLFDDPEFPPDNDLLRLRSKRIEDDVEWMRPSEYLELAKDFDEDTPILVSERNEGFDIKVYDLSFTLIEPI